MFDLRTRRSFVVVTLAALVSCRGLLALDEKELVGDSLEDAGAPDAGIATGADARVSTGDASDGGDPGDGAPSCPPNESLCGGGCISFASDRQNCGRCGRSCGTACDAGLCEPRFVTDVGPGYYVYGLADGDSYLYWTTDSVPGGAIRRVGKLGGTAQGVASPGGGPTGIVVTAPDTLYVASQFGQTVDRVLAGTVIPLVTGQPKAANIAVEADVIYFTRYAPVSGDVRRIPRDGGSATVLVPNLSNPLGIATDATHLYFTTNNSTDQGLWIAEKDGGAVTKLLDTTVSGDIGVDDDAIYSSDTTAGTVVRILKNGSGTTTIAEEKDVQALAIDADSVYWVSADGIVARAPKLGGPKTVLAAGQVEMEYHMVVDHTDVYWVAANGLWSVPK